jgi:hypothetical protein
MELSEQQQQVLQTVFDAFVEAGTWPTVTRVQRMLVHGHREGEKYWGTGVRNASRLRAASVVTINTTEAA